MPQSEGNCSWSLTCDELADLIADRMV